MNATMAKKKAGRPPKQNGDRTTDRRVTPFFTVRVPLHYQDALDGLARKHLRNDRTKEAVAAIDHWLRMHNVHPDGKPVE